MEIVHEELHHYDSGTNEYRLDMHYNNCGHQILYVKGFTTLDSGSVHHIFVNGTDYEQRGDKIYWLSGGNRPDVPPPVLGYEYTPFWITYVYDKRPETTVRSSLYPFLLKDGVLTSVMTAFGTQIFRSYKMREKMVRSRSLSTSIGTELDLLGSWYDTTRYDAESDLNFRARLQVFLSTFLSSGTPASIVSLMERMTGATPTIEELWEQTSYYDYDPVDASSTFVYDDGGSSNIARYFSFVNQPATFYVVFREEDYSVFPTYGPYILKKTLNLAKAEGVTGYLGYLVDESFGLDDNNWAKQTVVPQSGVTKPGTSSAGDWLVTGGEYRYLDNSADYADGLSVIDNSDFDDAWGDYQVTGYARDATGTVNQLAGIVTRWQASGTDQYDCYIFGISAEADKAFCYYWDYSGTSLTELGATGGVDVDGGVDVSSNYHLRVDMRGNSARFYVDNELLISDVDAWSALKYGRPGFACIDQTGTHAAQTAYFDEMNVVI